MENKRNRRGIESLEQQVERLEREALAQKVAQDADDDNVQAMIERSIKFHGA
jgi:hypothetical protein